ncbi:MAG: glycosyltransferase [Cyanobacteria bacterium]|nr:glycosyltransferase [Cyanobacteriota bacterium]MDW8200642.1 glycosyltransferase [Cyanobacteriota bacterium SKYGB_h_bin112]
MATQKTQQTIVKFLLGGGVAAAINLVVMYLLIDKLGWNTPLLRNLANAIAIELSLVASFFIYRIWVWPGGSWRLRDIWGRQLPLYHGSAGTAVFVRVVLLFPLLDWLRVHYGVNTIIGALVSAVINFVLSNRGAFTTKDLSPDRTLASYPESLASVWLPDRQPLGNRATLTQEPLPPVQTLSVVIPAHNEEACIVQTVQAIADQLTAASLSYEILVVNDNSRDRTEALLQALVAQNPHVRYINNYYPNGFGFAVKCGLENFRGDAVAIVMADNSDSPQNIVDYYYKLQQGYHCVFGSRFISGGRVIDYPLHKLVINRLANWFIQVLFGLDLNDTTNAFKMYRREVIAGIAPLLSHHFNLTVEMPLKAIVRGYSYAIIPITWQNRKTGISKLKLQEMGSRYLFIVLYVFLEKHLSRGDYARKPSPMPLLSVSQESPQ